MKLFRTFLLGLAVMATPAFGAGVTLLDPTTGLAYRAGAPDTPWQYAGVTGGITNTADVAIAPAAGGILRNYLCSLQVKNTAAVASEIVVKDGSTVIWRGHVNASMTFEEIITYSVCIRGSANTAMNVALITTGTATIVSAQGYTAR